MAVTPTTRNKLKKQDPGVTVNWGGPNGLNGILDRIDEAGDGIVTLNISASRDLTSTNYVQNEHRFRHHKITDGGLASAPTLTVPALEKWWFVENTTAYAVTYTCGGTTAVVPANSQRNVYCDGTNIYIRDLRLDQIPAPTASVALGSQKITGLANGADANDAVNKGQLDAIVNDANVAAVAGIADDVTAVAGMSSDISAVVADATDIGAVATNIANVNSVADNQSNIDAVAGNETNINAVQANEADIDTVAGNISDVSNVSTNMTAVQNASALVNGLTAADIAFTPGGDLAATTVDGALDELDGEKAPLADPTFTGTVTLPDGTAISSGSPLSSGSLVKIGSPTNVTTSTAAVDLSLPTGYSAFVLVIEGVTCSLTSTRWLRVAPSNDGGSTFSGASNLYQVTDASTRLSIVAHISGHRQSSSTAMVFGDVRYNTVTSHFGGGMTANDVDAIRWTYQTGTIESGKFTLYGYVE